jgi:hypothetical protein
MHPEALWAAATPLCTAVGAVVGFLLATEHTPLESDTEIHRGDSVDEPWGNPEPTREHTLPGAGWLRLPPDQALKRNDTAQIARVQDEGATKHDS